MTPANEFTRLLDMQKVQEGNGRCEIQLVVAPQHLSVAERVHGGVFFTMLDTAMGRAVISELPLGQGCATIEAKINYFRPVQGGTVRAVARCVNRSRRTAYCEGDLLDDEERLIARATGTFMITETMRPRSASASEPDRVSSAQAGASPR